MSTTTPVDKKFTYKARDADGDIRTGIAEAADDGQVSKHLQERGWMPLDIREGGPGLTTDFDIQLRTTAKLQSNVIGTRQLHECLKAGLPIPDTLEIMGDSDDPIYAKAVAAVGRDVANGRELSAALRRHPKAFPQVLPDMIQAGEKGGFLDKAAGQAADSFEAALALRTKIQKATMYPAVVMGLAGAIFIFMMVYIVPTFADLYSDMSNGTAELPALTRMVVAVSDSMIWLLPLLAVLAVAFIIWYRRHGKEERVREVWDPIKLKIPVFGKLFHMIALARFTRNLGSLLKAGVTVTESLALTAGIVGNIAMERAIMEARASVLKGKSLTDPLVREELFPKMVTQFIAAGEASGQVDDMLFSAAGIYDREIDKVTDNLTALIEPFFIVILGVMVGTIAIAIYLPYLNIGELMME